MKYLKIFLLTICSLTFVGCSSAYGKLDKIEDRQLLATFNEIIVDGVGYYFDVDVDKNLYYELEAFESHIPHNDEFIHISNVFQATQENQDFKEGDISGYGGILDPETYQITGMILNIITEQGEIISYTHDEVMNIATLFLLEKQLIEPNETVTYIETNTTSSSLYLTVINLESDNYKFAIGVNLQYGKVVYFEYATLDNFY